MMTSASIPQQAPLPLRMAASVVAQGIRIRLGRSLVTVSGIVLGIAFLSSMLASQALRRGFADEDQLRQEGNRRYGYLVAETGNLTRRAIAVMVTGPLSREEVRLLQRLERDKPSEVRVWAKASPISSGTFAALVPRPVSTTSALVDGAACVLVFGGRSLDSLGVDVTSASFGKAVVAVTRDAPEPRVSHSKLVQLERPLSAEERGRRARALERERFRGLWIVSISLLVTVIGITNAMLMSVTERFRDIGTMKCLGATSRFIRQVFLLEASVMGVVGGAVGLGLGLGVSLVTSLALYDATLVAKTLLAELPTLALAAAKTMVAAVALSVVAALYPARFAARMVPADALRSHV